MQLPRRELGTFDIFPDYQNKKAKQQTKIINYVDPTHAMEGPKCSLIDSVNSIYSFARIQLGMLSCGFVF